MLTLKEKLGRVGAVAVIGGFYGMFFGVPFTVAGIAAALTFVAVFASDVVKVGKAVVNLYA